MKLVKCSNGHYYDEERYNKCPHCNAEQSRNDGVTVPVMNEPIHDAVTVAMGVSGQGKSSLKDAVDAATTPERGEKTVGFFKTKMGTEPVVGWLVCVEGEHFGEDFKLKSGRNFIGRGSNMDVAIVKDNSVSREKHAVIVYEPRNNIFIAQPGESKELCYLNESVVLNPEQLKQGDMILVGNTKLMFVPCCNAAFNWDMYKKEN